MSGIDSPIAVDLAREIAEKNGRCGHYHGTDGICLRVAKHDGEHKYEPLSQVIPFN